MGIKARLGPIAPDLHNKTKTEIVNNYINGTAPNGGYTGAPNTAPPISTPGSAPSVTAPVSLSPEVDISPNVSVAAGGLTGAQGTPGGTLSEQNASGDLPDTSFEKEEASGESGESGEFEANPSSRDQYYNNAEAKATEIYDRDLKLLQDNYGASLSELDKNRTASEEMAAVTRERMLKYLPQQMRAQGINTQGVSEDALIKAHNNYQNTMADISANYDTQRGALDRQLTEDKNALADKRDSTLLGIDKDRLEHDEATEEKLLSAYGDIFGIADSGSYTKEQIYDLAIKRGMSEEDAEKLSEYADAAYSEVESEKTESESEADEAEYRESYNGVWKTALSGSYTKEQIYDLAIRNGMSPEDAKELSEYADEVYSKVESEKLENETKTENEKQKPYVYEEVFGFQPEDDGYYSPETTKKAAEKLYANKDLFDEKEFQSYVRELRVATGLEWLVNESVPDIYDVNDLKDWYNDPTKNYASAVLLSVRLKTALKYADSCLNYSQIMTTEQKEYFETLKEECEEMLGFGGSTSSSSAKTTRTPHLKFVADPYKNY